MNNKEQKYNLKALMKNAKNGDTEAFGVIYSEYFTPIFRYVYFRVKNKEIAEDLVQTIFMKTLQSVGNFEDRDKEPLSYFFTIARNTIFDYWKKKKDVLIGDMESDISSIPDESETALSALRKNDTSIALRCAVSKLPDEQQEIITLKFINDLSNREISRILGKKEDAIRQLQCRAIRNLKDIFKNNIKL